MKIYFFHLIKIFFASCAILCATCCSHIRTIPHGNSGCVSAATPEAVSAGIEILQGGGNAIDAAIAVAFTLAVTEPGMSGLGGQLQVIIASPHRKPLIVNGTSFSPKNLPENVSSTDLVGHRASTVPSFVRTLDYIWRSYGSGNVNWESLVKPAIRFAEKGFVIGPYRNRVLLQHKDDLAKHHVTRTLFLKKDGSVPNEGDRLKQPVLAKTLKRLEEYGADDYYKGEIAREIARDMLENHGWITLEDLNNVPQPVELEPLQGTYRGWDIYTSPPPSGGWVVLQVLNLLEQTPSDQLFPGDPSRTAMLVNALYLGHKNRYDAPVQNLLDYRKEIDLKIDKTTALEILNDEDDSGETTHFSVVDASGLVVGVTASINSYYGAQVASPKLGFLYNDYMQEFELDNPEHPFALRPGAMPYSSMCPTVLRKGVEVYMVLGSPGSSRIISTVSQVIQLWVDTSMGIHTAVSAPRIHVNSSRQSLYFESQNIPTGILEELQGNGFMVRAAPTGLAHAGMNPYFGGVHALAREEGRWCGAADPRRDGVVKCTHP